MKHATLLLSFCLAALFSHQGRAETKASLGNLGETKNLATTMPEKLTEMQALLEKLITDGRSTPGAKQKNDVEVVRYPKK